MDNLRMMAGSKSLYTYVAHFSNYAPEHNERTTSRLTLIEGVFESFSGWLDEFGREAYPTLELHAYAELAYYLPVRRETF